jgi:Fic-DOC domain mobile mystery protein B
VNDLFRTHLGDTPLSEDDRLGLLQNLSNQRELNQFEEGNIKSARDWAQDPLRFAREEILNASYLLDLHKRMFNQTWRWAGKFRTTEKTIGIAPHRIGADLAVLLGDTQYWIEHHVYASDEIALRFHHRLVFIHPFVNGNGRHARLAADLLVLKLGRPEFTWGRNTGEPLTIRRSYLDALREADNQNYLPLFRFARSGEY